MVAQKVDVMVASLVVSMDAWMVVRLVVLSVDWMVVLWDD